MRLNGASGPCLSAGLLLLLLLPPTVESNVKVSGRTFVNEEKFWPEKKGSRAGTPLLDRPAASSTAVLDSGDGDVWCFVRSDSQSLVGFFGHFRLSRAFSAPADEDGYGRRVSKMSYAEWMAETSINRKTLYGLSSAEVKRLVVFQLAQQMQMFLQERVVGQMESARCALGGSDGSTPKKILEKSAAAFQEDWIVSTCIEKSDIDWENILADLQANGRLSPALLADLQDCILKPDKLAEFKHTLLVDARWAVVVEPTGLYFNRVFSRTQQIAHGPQQPAVQQPLAADQLGIEVQMSSGSGKPGLRSKAPAVDTSLDLDAAVKRAFIWLNCQPGVHKMRLVRSWVAAMLISKELPASVEESLDKQPLPVSRQEVAANTAFDRLKALLESTG